MDKTEKVSYGLRCMCYGDTECRECPYANDGHGWHGCRSNCAEDALEMLKDQRWIPVTEKLPRNMANKVLVYIQHDDYVPYIGYGHYEKFRGEEMWFDLENDEEFIKRGYRVTHWMPLPVSPDGEKLCIS